MARNRMFRNYISDSTLQFRFAAMISMIFLVMVGGVVGYSYIYLQKIMIAIFEIPDVPDGASSIYESMLGGYFLGISVLLVTMCAFATAYIVVQTHKIAGAKFAILRHIREDLQNFYFDRPIRLRDTDYLHDVATELNRLADIIRAKGVLLPEPRKTERDQSARDSDNDQRDAGPGPYTKVS